MNAHPPRLGLWLLDRLLDSPPPKREEVAGDLLEVMRNVEERRGLFLAKCRYLTEVALLALWRLKDLKTHRAIQVGSQSSSGRSPMESLVRDLRFAVRNLTSSPFFTAVSVTTLAIGIGATVTLFSVVNGVLLRPLEFENPEELVLLKTIWGERSFEHLSQPDILDIKEQNGTLTALEIWRQDQATLVGSDGWPEIVDAAIGTDGYFSLRGVQPHLGRFFLGEEGGGGRNG